MRAQGHSPETAHKIAVAALQKSGNLKQGSEEPTEKGIRRGNMTPGQRAIDRAAKYSGNDPSRYSYNPFTNRATLKKSK